MFLKRLLIISMLAGPLYGLAQHKDSLEVLQAKWNKQRLHAKVQLYQYHFKDSSLFNSNQSVSYVVLRASKRGPQLFIDDETQKLVATTEFAKRNDALAAINGTFFDMRKGGSVDYVRKNGQMLHENQLGKEGQRARHQQAGISIYQGKADIVKWDGTADWEHKLQANDVMLSGPLLFFKGKDELLDSTEFNRFRHPRSAIGKRENGDIILLTVDGRNANAAGMSMYELKKLMRWLGCSEAINLDGGGSTALYVKEKGIVSFPSDNKKWDHDGERKVANVVYIK